MELRHREPRETQLSQSCSNCSVQYTIAVPGYRQVSWVETFTDLMNTQVAPLMPTPTVFNAVVMDDPTMLANFRSGQVSGLHHALRSVQSVR